MVLRESPFDSELAMLMASLALVISDFRDGVISSAVWERSLNHYNRDR
jgi:hypothetical protein